MKDDNVIWIFAAVAILLAIAIEIANPYSQLNTARRIQAIERKLNEGPK